MAARANGWDVFGASLPALQAEFTGKKTSTAQNKTDGRFAKEPQPVFPNYILDINRWW
jgi:hypothetical protein